MDMRQLEAFKALVEYKSFSEAAKFLHVTQPAVSSSLNSLEKELQTKLVVRSTRSIEITPAGQKMYLHAKNILQQREKVFDDLSGLNRKNIYISLSVMQDINMLPELLTAFHEKNPETNFQIFADNVDDIVKRVSGYEIDLGIIDRKVSHPGCSCVAIETDGLVIACPNNHHFRSLKETKTPACEILKEPMLIKKSDGIYFTEAFTYADNQGMRKEDFQIVLETDDMNLLVKSVIAGLGISIMSKNRAREHALSGEMLLFPLEESICKKDLYIIYSDSDYMPYTARNFIDFLRHRYSQEYPEL